MSIKFKQTLPEIPGKLYFTIGETSELCDIKPHVLRYWEQEFLQLKPSKRRGGRRYYQHKDIELIRRIRELLYIKGFTIAGAKQQISIHKPEEIKEASFPQSTVEIVEKVVEKSVPTGIPKEILSTLITDLESLLETIQA